MNYLTELSANVIIYKYNSQLLFMSYVGKDQVKSMCSILERVKFWEDGIVMYLYFDEQFTLEYISYFK